MSNADEPAGPPPEPATARKTHTVRVRPRPEPEPLAEPIPVHVRWPEPQPPREPITVHVQQEVRAVSNAAQRMQAVRARQAVVEAEPAPEEQEAPGRPRSSRQTVDVPYHHHVALAAWRQETAAGMGVLRVTNQEVLAALVEVLLTDETVARRVRTTIATNARAKRRDG